MMPDKEVDKLGQLAYNLGRKCNIFRKWILNHVFED